MVKQRSLKPSAVFKRYYGHFKIINDYKVIKTFRGEKEKRRNGKALMNKAVNKLQPSTGQNSQAQWGQGQGLVRIWTELSPTGGCKMRSGEICMDHCGIAWCPP